MTSARCRATPANKLACSLLRRLAALGVPVLVVSESHPFHWLDDGYRAVTRHARRSRIVLGEGCRDGDARPVRHDRRGGRDAGPADDLSRAPSRRRPAPGSRPGGSPPSWKSATSRPARSRAVSPPRSRLLSAAKRGRGRGPSRSDGKVRWCRTSIDFPLSPPLPLTGARSMTG